MNIRVEYGFRRTTNSVKADNNCQTFGTTFLNVDVAELPDIALQESMQNFYYPQ